jgi:hypothetical protein
MLIVNEKLRKISGALLLISTFFLSSCATYYQRNLKFQEAFSNGEIERANELLDKNEKDAEGRNRLLFLMKKGVVLQMLGQFEESNLFLEEAYIFLEDYKKNYGIEALSLLTNPSIKPYTGEDHEKVLLHYYKALNYLQLNQPQKALVECRRLNAKLNELNDKYENKKNQYKTDAFAHNLMGIAYEMDGDVNNAFIAFRNAYNAYKDSYSTHFGVAAPEQLKKDLMRTAYLNGFIEELLMYEREFGVKYDLLVKSDGELIFFWHNGLGPVKGEWSINFTIVRGQNGTATFVNEELGLNFPYIVPASHRDDPKGGLGDLKLIRVAFPKYLSRKPYFTSASLWTDSLTQYPLEKAENIEAIAYSVLKDRMLREVATSIARLAVKQASELAAREKNDDIGAIISVVNALTEKADTRNWQTLPHSISYSRIPLKAGSNPVRIKVYNPQNKEASLEEAFEFNVENGKKTFFHIYNSLDSYAPRSY